MGQFGKLISNRRLKLAKKIKSELNSVEKDSVTQRKLAMSNYMKVKISSERESELYFCKEFSEQFCETDREAFVSAAKLDFINRHLGSIFTIDNPSINEFTYKRINCRPHYGIELNLGA